MASFNMDANWLQANLPLILLGGFGAFLGLVLIVAFINAPRRVVAVEEDLDQSGGGGDFRGGGVGDEFSRSYSARQCLAVCV